MSQSARITLLLLLLFSVAVVIAIITSGKYSLTVNELWTVVSSKLTGHIEESNSNRVLANTLASSACCHFNWRWACYCGGGLSRYVP